MRPTSVALSALLFAIAHADSALCAPPLPDVTITVVDNLGQLEERINTLSLPPAQPAAASAQEKHVSEPKVSAQDQRANRLKPAGAPPPRVANASQSVQASKRTQTVPAAAGSPVRDLSPDKRTTQGERSVGPAVQERQDFQPDIDDGAAQDRSDSERQDTEHESQPEPQPGPETSEPQESPQTQPPDTQGSQPPSRTPIAGAAD